MTDKLSTRNGETIPIDQMIEALERTPDSGEILQALKDLRRDKVKRALGESVKAAQFDRDQVFDEFLADGEKSERTKRLIKMSVGVSSPGLPGEAFTRFSCAGRTSTDLKAT